MKISSSFFALFACFAVTFSSGCATPTRNAILIDVPFIPQEQTNQCGVVSLAMALDHYGVPYDLDALATKAFIPFLGGSSLQLLADTAGQYGLSVARQDADAHALKTMLSQNCLPLIYLFPAEEKSAGHFALVTGISTNLRRVRIHGTSQANRWVRLSRLQPHYKHSRFPTLCLGRPLPAHRPSSDVPETTCQKYQGKPDAQEP